MIELCLALLIVIASTIYYLELHRIEWFAVYTYVVVLFNLKLHMRKTKNKPYSFVDEVESIVDRHPDRIQFITVENGKSYTLSVIDKLANQIGHWGLTLGLKQKDTVAIMLMNHPDYLSLWLGLGKIGVSSALINTNNSG